MRAVDAHEPSPSTPLSERALLERDAADLLSSLGTGGVAVTVVAAAAIAALVTAHGAGALPLVWLGAMLVVLLARTVDLYVGRLRRADRRDWKGRHETFRYGVGVVATAVMWALFPLAFFGGISSFDRTAFAVIVAAMAGGSATVLAGSRSIAIVYGAGLLLPASIMFLRTPGPDNVLLGLLGVVFFFIFVFATGITNRAVMTALRLNRANQTLLVGMRAERERSDRANDELLAAQSTLNETLESLEERIRERTSDLEREIRERERYSRELALLASRDPLTGLFNRTSLSERLAGELARAERENRRLAILFLDLDKFKEVNDLLGHHWGDHVLREVAQRLVGRIPPQATAARWGGDEFVFAFDAPSNGESIEALAKALRRGVCDPILVDGETVRVDATIGIAHFPDHGTTADELIRAADMAMYAAKQAGRGRVMTFEPLLADALGSRHGLEQALREAIASEGLFLEFQPIVSSSERSCSSFEALVRWRHPTRGVIGPVEFIPLAERSGDIVAIGRWVLERACVAAATWTGDPLPAVAVNVSVAQIVAGGLMDDVRHALAVSGLDARRLHLEVTESLFASEFDATIPTLQGLRAMGIRISIDDFGTGFSSLGYLRSLPVDTIKIDRSFVEGMHGDSAPIIAAIHSLASAFELDIIAEGVETMEQATALRAMGVHALQGYYFARPLPDHRVQPTLDACAATLPHF